MKKGLSIILSVLLTLVLLCTGVPFALAEDVTIVASGDCGEWNNDINACSDNVKWTLDSEGTLTISGAGKMYYGQDESGRHFDSNALSWWKYRRKIQNIIIEDGVTNLPNYTFSSSPVENLKSVTIPASVEIDERLAPFDKCPALERIIVSEDHPTLRSDAYGCLYERIQNDEWRLLQCPQNSPVKDFSIAENVVEIAPRAFDENKNIEKIYIPQSLRKLGEGGYIAYVDDYGVYGTYGSIFCHCDRLQMIRVDENNPYFASDEFGCLYNKDKTTLLQYPIGNERKAFAIPETVTRISKDAFSNSSFLEQITIPDALSVYGEQFTGYSALQRFIVSENHPTHSVDENGCLLNKAGDTLICYPAGRTDEKFVIPSYITKVCEYAFDHCQFLKELVVPGTVKETEKASVSHCDALETLTVCEAVGHTVEDCSNIKTWILGEDVETLNHDDYVTVEQILVDENNPYYSSVDGVLFNKDQTALVKYPARNPRKAYTVPASVKTISFEAFGGAFYLESLTLPEGLQTIEDYTLVEVPFLKTAVLPASLEKVEEFAFLSEIYADEPDYTVKGMNTEFSNLFGAAFARFKNTVPADLRKEILLAIYGLAEPSESVQPYLENFRDYIEYCDYENGEIFYPGTIHCHAGSTAEAYAIEHGMNYELTHFFEGDWTYDWDNLVRWRKCIHCDERETEPLEKETSGDAEIIAPSGDEGTFNSEKQTEKSSNYVLVQSALRDHHPAPWNIVNVYDITFLDRDGNAQQPSGWVQVRLPLRWAHDHYKVYRVNTDGTLTDMHAQRMGDCIVFNTDHFSLYVVVDESGGSSDDSTDEPQSGDFFTALFRFLAELLNRLTAWLAKR